MRRQGREGERSLPEIGKMQRKEQIYRRIPENVLVFPIRNQNTYIIKFLAAPMHRNTRILPLLKSSRMPNKSFNLICGAFSRDPMP